jgi:hypothetical protein
VLLAVSAPAANAQAPSHLSPVYETRAGGVVAAGPGGLALGVQYFGFDPATKTAGPHRHSRFGQQLYGNTVIDSKRLSPLKRLDFGQLVLTTTEKECAKVSIIFENHAEVIVSEGFVVSPTSAATSTRQPATALQPSVLLYFDPRPSSGTQQRPVSGTLVVHRGGKLVLRVPVDGAKIPAAGLDYWQTVALPLAETGFPIVEINGVRQKNDVLEWRVESGGKTTQGGIVAFPVVGSIPRLVAYGVLMSDHPGKE